MKVSVADAKNKLPELIKAVEGGETVTIYRRGVPVVDIVLWTKEPSGKKRKLGALKGKIQILDSDWWKPMSEDEADAFVEGRDEVRLLLDTVALVFAVESSERFTKRASAILQNTENILELERNFSFRNCH